MMHIPTVPFPGPPGFHHFSPGLVAGRPLFSLVRPPLIIVVFIPVVPGHYLCPGSDMKNPRIPASPMPTWVTFCIIDSGKLMPTSASMAAREAQLEGYFKRFKIMYIMVYSFFEVSVKPGSNDLSWILKLFPIYFSSVLSTSECQSPPSYRKAIGLRKTTWRIGTPVVFVLVILIRSFVMKMPWQSGTA